MTETYEYIVRFVVGKEARYRYYYAKTGDDARSQAMIELPGCMIISHEFTGNSIRTFS